MAMGADLAGIEFTTSLLVDADTILVLAGQPIVADIKFKPEGSMDLFRDRMQMQAYAMMHSKTLKRPSWLHPIKRVLWVHHHGPHRPTVQVPRVDLKSIGVIKNITN